MDANTLLENFDVLANASGGVDRLRELIINLALEGNLLPISVWHKGCLDDLVSESVTDGDWIESKDQDPNGDVRLIQLADIGAFSFRDRSNRFVNRQTFSRLKCTLLKRGDVLIARLPDPIGRACVFPGLDQDCITVVDVAIVRPDLKRLLPEYLVLLLNSVEMHTRVTKEAAGTTRLRIATGKIRKMPLNFPKSTAEQRLIVEKVEELMSICDKLEHQQKQRDNFRTAARKSAIDAISTATTPEELETAWKRINNNWDVIADTPESVQSLRNLIYSLAVRGSLCETDTTEEPIDIPKMDGPFEVPQNWRWTRIQDVSNFVNGYAFPSGGYKENGVGVIRMSDMKDGKIVTNGMRFVSKTYFEQLNPSMRVFPGDLVMGMTGATLGKPCFNLTDSIFLLNQRIGKFEPFAINPKFLGIVLLTMERKFMEISFGTGVNNLSTKQIKESIFPIPPPLEQARIVAKVDELMALCDQLESELKSRSEVAEKFARSVVSATV
jgi:type I restriction enzyme S subunit